MCVGSRAVAGGSLQEWLSVRHLGLDHDQTAIADYSIQLILLRSRVAHLKNTNLLT